MGDRPGSLRVLSAIYILCAQEKFVLEVGALHTGRSRISELMFHYDILNPTLGRVARRVLRPNPTSNCTQSPPNFFQSLPFPLRYPPLHNFKYAQH